jgi:DNA-binding transcriptional regulator GbsR (MarR family)
MAKTLNAELQFANENGLLFEGAGLPRITGRVLGWLMVCEPEYQSLPDLTEALGISKASASTSMRMLIQMGFTERVILTGDRRDYFHLSDDAFANFFRRRVEVIHRLRKNAERGLRVLEGAPPSRRSRLERMHRLFTFIERNIPALVERFEADDAKRHRGRADKNGGPP